MQLSFKLVKLFQNLQHATGPALDAISADKRVGCMSSAPKRFTGGCVCSATCS